MYNYGAWGAQPQLPLGWEAKWDPGSRRWFYIDHSTKTTHWELPKFPAPQKTVSFAQNFSQPARPAVVPKASFITALKFQFPTATEDIIKQVLITSNNDFMDSKTQLSSMGYEQKIEITPDPKLVKQLVAEHISVSQTFAESLLRKHDNDMNAVKKALGEKGYRKKPAQLKASDHHVKTLKKEYPDAGEIIIKEVLVSSSNSIGNARKALERMGYKKFTKPKAAAPLELSEATKKDRLATLKRKFPNLTEKVIKMALEGTKYDLNLSTSVLQLSVDSVRSKSSMTGASHSSDAPSASTSIESTSPSSSNLEPVIFGAEASGFEPVVFGADSTTGTTVSLTPAKTVPKVQTPRPRNAPRARVPAMKKTYHKKAAVTGYVSEYRCVPSGPDADLVRGPDNSLLQESLIKLSGPDPMNRCGSQASHVNGPDPGNARGSAGLAVGPMSATLIETMV